MGEFEWHAMCDACIALAEARLDAVDAKIDAVDAKLDTKIDLVESRLVARIDGVDEKVRGIGVLLERLESKAETGLAHMLASSIVQVGFVQVQPVQATVPGQCPKCGAAAGFHLELTQTRALLLVLPLVGFSSPKAGRCLACGGPPPPAVWRAMPRPSVVWRFGWLFFFVLPAVVFGGGYGLYEHLHMANVRAARAKQDAEQKRRTDDLASIQSASNDCRDAYRKGEQAEDACTKGVNDVMHAATKDVDKERERAPTSALGRVPVAVIGKPVAPDSPLLGDDTCPAVVPRNKLGYVVDSACSRSDASPDEIRADGNKMAAAATKLKTPDRFAIISFECGAKTCSTTATWFDTPSKTILAVARATKPKTSDEKADKKALADALAKKIAAWK